MALTVPIDHKFLISLDTSSTGTQTLCTASRVIPTNGSQTLRIRLWIYNVTLTRACFLDYILLGKDIAGTTTIVGAGANSLPVASANPQADIAILEGDEAITLSGGISTHTMQFNLITSNTNRRLLYGIVDETTITWT